MALSAALSEAHPSNLGVDVICELALPLLHPGLELHSNLWSQCPWWSGPRQPDIVSTLDFLSGYLAGGGTAGCNP